RTCIGSRGIIVTREERRAVVGDGDRPFRWNRHPARHSAKLDGIIAWGKIAYHFPVRTPAKLPGKAPATGRGVRVKSDRQCIGWRWLRERRQISRSVLREDPFADCIVAIVRDIDGALVICCHTQWEIKPGRAAHSVGAASLGYPTDGSDSP